MLLRQGLKLELEKAEVGIWLSSFGCSKESCVDFSGRKRKTRVPVSVSCIGSRDEDAHISRSTQLLSEVLPAGQQQLCDRSFFAVAVPAPRKEASTCFCRSVSYTRSCRSSGCLLAFQSCERDENFSLFASASF